MDKAIMRANCASFELESDLFGPPTSPGVYAVVVRNRDQEGADHVLYVGSSWNIRSRINGPTHPYRLAIDMFNNRMVILRFRICDNYRELEQMVIRELRPLLNTHHNG